MCDREIGVVDGQSVSGERSCICWWNLTRNSYRSAVGGCHM